MSFISSHLLSVSTFTDICCRLLINAPSVFTVLSDIDRVVLHPFGQGPLLGQAIDYMLQDDNAELNGTIMDKIRRPPNAFILYRKARHQRVKDHNPGIHNNQICK